VKILFAAIGSYGDINPYIALALELKRRGHSCTLATASYYRDVIEKQGLGFAPLRPDASLDDVELIKKVMDPKKGSETIVRELVMPELRNMHADLKPAAEAADVLVSHVLTYAMPILGEQLKKPWVSTVLSPLVFFSPHDVPVLPPAPWLASFMRPLGPRVNTGLIRLMKKISYSWSAPVRAFRRELGLAPGGDPLWEGQHSPHAVLAMFSAHFAAPQPDWPAHTTVCGFPFLDDVSTPLNPELVEFMATGEPPLVFTLGSSAVMSAGDFYSHAIAAATALKRRAVLVAGPRAEELSKSLPPSIKAVGWAAFPPLFANAAVVVHPGGIGTTAQALRGGRPQLVVPFANDQFDNADHVKRLGVGGVLYQTQVNAPRLTRTLKMILSNANMARAAALVGGHIRAERGVSNACDIIEQVGQQRRHHGT
jgi:UDP:flavonoid glycosyltransferase YjiC (YdhE family)